MNDTLTLTIRNDFGELAPLTERVNEFLESISVPSETAFTINFALEELLTNIIKYGYDDENYHEIGVNLERIPSGVVITLTDDGHEFDPRKQAPPDLSKPIFERERGGLGIFLLKDMADSIEYRRDQGMNVVTVRIVEKAS